MMKSLCLLALSLGFGHAFVVPSQTLHATPSCLFGSLTEYTEVSHSRKDFLQQISVTGVAIATPLLWNSLPANARGRATLEKSIERYAPRVRAGGVFYRNELRQLIEKNDWAGIKNALQEPPERTKADLNKSDAGVSGRAKQAGGFSDAKVLTAADLLAGAFSDNSISPKTKKLQASVARLREIVQEMQKTTKLALGEEKAGGIFGIGAKAPDQVALAKDIRKLYVEGGNVWNQYIMDLNDDLALQFDRFDYLK